jgi:hypothetical protein
MQTLADEHEIAFITSFVSKPQTKRCLWLRENDRTRWLDRLCHQLQHELRDQFVVSEQIALAAIADKKIKACVVFGDVSQRDKESVSVDEGIRLVRSSFMAAIGSFVAGRIACLRPEAPSDLIWLLREG